MKVYLVEHFFEYQDDGTYTKSVHATREGAEANLDGLEPCDDDHSGLGHLDGGTAETCGFAIDHKDGCCRIFEFDVLP